MTDFGDMGLRFGANNAIQKQSTCLAEQIITKRVDMFLLEFLQSVHFCGLLKCKMTLMLQYTYLYDWKST